MFHRKYKPKYTKKYSGYRSTRSVPRPVKRYVLKEIHKNIENKSQQSALVDNFGSISNSWSELVVCNPAEGTQENQRVGRMITIRSLEIKGIICNGASGTLTDDPYNVVRVVVALWNGADVSPLGGGIANINSPITKTYFSGGNLIRKYLDQYIPLEVTGTEKGQGDGYTPQLKQFKYYKKLNIKLYYAANDQTLYDKLLIVSMISDSSAVPHPGFVAGYIKVTFEDG